jgi:hypothetical protein
MYNLSGNSTDIIISFLKSCGIVKHEYEEKVISSYLNSLELQDDGHLQLQICEKYSNETQKPGWGEE